VTGDRPMTFSADNLPPGLKLDVETGLVTGTAPEIKSADKPAPYTARLHAKNALGTADREFTIIVGAEIALTPPLGWNSWNCWGTNVDADKVRQSAEAMVKSGLINHGWTYINVDDTWQGKRGGEFNGIQPNEKFPDMKGLADTIHAMGLKFGIYSTPWITSYAGLTGGSADNPDGIWPPPEIAGTTNKPPRRPGKCR